MDRGKEIELAANAIIENLNGLEKFDKIDMINMFGSGVTWAEEHQTIDDKECKFCKGESVKEWACLGRSRSGGLKFGCKEIVNHMDFGKSCSLKIIGETLSIYYNAYSCDSSFYDEIKIKFCPFCGRRLNNLNNNLL